MLDWADLRYLRAIGSAGSLAAAARELDVEHTTVGRRLSSIEAQLGTRLFARGPSGLVPTAAFDAIRPALDAIAALVEQIERDASGGDTRLDGKVRLTAPELMSPYLVHELARFRERQPGIEVEMLSAEHKLDILRGEADLAIRATEVTEPDLVVRQIAIAGASLYASPAYLERRGKPAAIDDLAGHDIIGLAGHVERYPGGTWLEAHAGRARVVMSAHTVPAMYSAALEGVGLAVLPCKLGADPRLVRIAPEVLGKQAVYLVAHPDLVKTARVRAVMDFVIEVFARDRAEFAGDAG